MHRHAFSSFACNLADGPSEPLPILVLGVISQNLPRNRIARSGKQTLSVVWWEGMAEEWQSLISADTKIKVSSTLDKSVGKKYLTDGSPETCWTSQQGIPQYIQLSFPSPVIPKRVELTFQGGFVGTRCSVEVLPVGDTERRWRSFARIFPEDVNRKQTFDITPEAQETVDHRIESIKLVFEESSDFFGRVTVYDLQMLGTVPS
ncbi:hypothetical protein BC628DRAFT_1360890 [Trametes gibbosa]|nr:hypothetical protein BC628DRAFT_1360890 [Trametes gibbosa]